ncbi:putative ubiquitin-conjugating enzyme E2 38 [Papaver somniferum]|uniref:putative ubiquitin-conjugating enzyme E2 38 n=1 Tax=Papaver somniferum TaxID=3469 RepID=UPI000E6FACF6|nr:putative ubiquitin-conjugating enzyme E2 38 [Papaver somniferum]
MAATSNANEKIKTIQEDAAIMSTEPSDEMVTSDHSDNDDGSEMYDSDDNQIHDFEAESDYEFEAPDFVEYDDEAAALQAKFDAEDLPADAEVSVPWLAEDRTRPPVPCSSSKVPMQFQDDDSDESIMKYKSFQSFDTVEDFSDHYYKSKSVTKSKQASQKWTRAIQQDWRLLEKDLPDTIFARAYEGRMDLLRAAIVGAAETPYHDGLFFFDIHFPSEYPDTPPLVNYHAHNLRLNPNLYNCGKVCLSLLNTWNGRREEHWTPGQSTMLQVLLSIQALVLNEKPYFNEPGWAPQAGTVHGEKAAREYNESTFILSCKTMEYTLKNPPKYFEDYVLGHFRVRAYTILMACKAYIEGALVGAVVKEEEEEDNESQNSSKKEVGKELQNVNEGKKYGSYYYNRNPFPSGHFKSEVGVMAGNLVPMFISKGAKNCEQFICLGDAYRLDEANYTNIFKKDFFKPVKDQDAAAESQAQI